MGDAGVLVIADVWGVITAIATSVLAIGVFLTGFGVWIAYRQGRDQAKLAQKVIGAAERQVDASLRQVDAAQDQAKAAHDQANSAREHVDAAQGQATAAQKQAEAAHDQVAAAQDQTRAAQDQAKAAQDQVDVAQDHVRAAQDQAKAAYAQIEAMRRPILTDVSENTSRESDLDPERHPNFNFKDGHTVEKADWRRAYVDHAGASVYIAVPLRNVGAGLAVIERGHSELRGTGGGGKTILDAEPKSTYIHRERVAPGETMRILCVGKRLGDGELTSLQVAVRYKDFLGGQTTVARVELEHAGEQADPDRDSPDNHHKQNYWRVRQVDNELAPPN
jgi:hypothetical protein